MAINKSNIKVCVGNICQPTHQVMQLGMSNFLQQLMLAG